MKLLILLIKYYAENCPLSAVYLLCMTFCVLGPPPVFRWLVAIDWHSFMITILDYYYLFTAIGFAPGGSGS
jgi:hypothetical protein